MDNSLLAVRDINHKYIVVERNNVKKYFLRLSFLYEIRYNLAMYKLIDLQILLTMKVEKDYAK